MVGNTLRILVRCFAGFVVGWLIYMVAMMATVYDGITSLIFQPIMGAICSALFVVAALLAGLPLRTQKLRNAWSRIGGWSLLLPVAAVGVMIFNAPLGLQTELSHPETGEAVRMMAPVPAVICYFLAIFPVVNFPGGPEASKSTRIENLASAA